MSGCVVSNENIFRQSRLSQEMNDLDSCIFAVYECSFGDLRNVKFFSDISSEKYNGNRTYKVAICLRGNLLNKDIYSLTDLKLLLRTLK